MTRKEAIKYLKQIYPQGGHCWLDEQRIEAINMAVEALKEKPTRKLWHNGKNCTPSSDREIIVRRGDKNYYGKYIGGARRFVCAEIRLTCDTAETYAIINFMADDDKWAYLDDIQKVELYMKRVQESAFEKGRDDMKKQMMADAIERRVKVDAGGYPYIDSEIELYDYEKDVALAKKGDIAKVLVVIDD